MSTETKIGLIIGLGFIVCFAVLLANSDPEQKSAVQWTHVVDGVGPNRFDSQPPPKVVQVKRASGLKVAGAWAAHPDHVSPPRKRVSIRSDRPSNLPLRQPVPATMGNRQHAAPSSSPPPDQLVDGGVSSAQTLDATAATPLVDAQDKVRLREYLNARKNPQSQPSAAGEPTGNIATKDETSRTNEAAPSPRRTPRRSNMPARGGARSPRRHVVVAGDTLTRIAGKYYGSQSQKVIDAIFDANRANLPDADHLSLGMKITLPPMKGFDSSVTMPLGAGGISPADRSTKSKPRPTIKKASPTWYQIQKNDRYVSIAQAQLGDGSRWREIHDLNKDRFPDPGRIQWGVRIRLPAVNLASARNP